MLLWRISGELDWCTSGWLDGQQSTNTGTSQFNTNLIIKLMKALNKKTLHFPHRIISIVLIRSPIIYLVFNLYYSSTQILIIFKGGKIRFFFILLLFYFSFFFSDKSVFLNGSRVWPLKNTYFVCQPLIYLRYNWWSQKKSQDLFFSSIL